MTPIAYVAAIHQSGPSDFLVTFPDVPEAIAQGDTLEEAKANAYDALAVALVGYLKRGMTFPTSAIGLMRIARGDERLCDVAVEPKLAERAGRTGTNAKWRH